MEQSKFYQIKNVTECEYTLVGCDGSLITRSIQEVDKIASAFTIQDARDGDVLSYNDGHGNDCIELIKSITDKKIEFWFCLTNGNQYEVFDGVVPYTNLASREDAAPTTKEQRDLLFQKIKEAGYEWNAEKKELKKIEQKSYQETLDEAIELYYYSYGNGKGGFNKLSLENFKDIVKTFVEDYGNKPAEWSEEDEGMYLRTLGILGTCRLGVLPTKVEEELKWLKSLKPQQNQYDKGYNDGYSAAKYNHWKPSKEQMEIVENLLACEMPPRHKKIFESLYNDLKNLRS